MKLRLRIAVANRPPRTSEHASSVIRIGRDPAGELVFDDPGIDTVSWNHARIDLSPRGATLRDLGSTNGTFVGDQRLTEAVLLRPGDEFRLGQAGPAVQVIDVDMSVPALRPAPVRTVAAPAAGSSQMSPQVLLAGGGVLGLLLIIGFIWWWNSRPQQPVVEGPRPTEPKPTVPHPTPPQPTTNGIKPPTGREPILKPVEPRFLGQYLRLEKAPSVLLERQRNSTVWGRLKPNQAVFSNQHLMSLPGYRSQIQLESEVKLSLWGNVPAFSYPPPVLESVLTLHDPRDPDLEPRAAPDTDLDFTLDRGRVLLGNGKKTGAALIRIRFRSQAWDLTLPGPGSEAVVEMWGSAAPDAAGKDAGPVNLVDLFIKGGATLKVRDRTFALEDKSQVTWTSDNRVPLQPRTVRELPPWWTKRPDINDKWVAETIVALLDFDEGINYTDPVQGSVLATMRKNVGEPGARALGVLFLTALDALPQVVENLEDASNEAVRLAARAALQVWISRGADHQRDLARVLFEQRGFAKDRVQVILRLLQGFGADELRKPETFATLIGYLTSEDLVVRDLAWAHLTYLAPEEAKPGLYDPTATPEKRSLAQGAMKKLIPDGQLPKRPN